MLTTARRIWRHRSLLGTLTSRDLKARYRGSVLGYFWSLVNPVVLLAVYTFVFSTLFDPRDPNVHPYALFLVTGLFPWIWLQSSWLEGSESLLANSGLIKKAAFPAELLPIVPVLSNLIHFALAWPVMALAFAIFGIFGEPAGGLTALILPLVVLVQMPMVAGLALGFAVLNAHFKDVRDLLANLLTLLFFLSPILYTLDRLEGYPLVQAVVALNPVTPYVTSYQEAVFFGHFPSPFLWLQMAFWSAVIWGIGTWVFDRLGETLVEAV